jgi:hypothetical protein
MSAVVKTTTVVIASFLTRCLLVGDRDAEGGDRHVLAESGRCRSSTTSTGAEVVLVA